MNFLRNLRWLLFSIIGGVVEGFSTYELDHSRRNGLWVGLIGVVITAVASFFGWERKKSE